MTDEKVRVATDLLLRNLLQNSQREKAAIKQKLSTRLRIARARLKHERTGIVALIKAEAAIFASGDKSSRCMAAELEYVARLIERADDLRPPRRPLWEG